MQSYGVRSMWDKRDTWHIPTLSAVTCMIASALGTHANSDIMRINNSVKRMTVRVLDEGTQFVDYQTMIGGIKSARSKRGNIKIKNGTTVIERAFLADAKFMVLLETSLSTEIEGGLKTPRNSVYLGHKSCVPSAPLLALPTDFDYDQPGEEWGETALGQLVSDRYIHYGARAFAPRRVGRLQA